MKGNVSRGDGGAIDNSSDLTLTNSEISGNFAALGGGIYSAGLAASLTITNSTITENTASIGGGLLNIGQASLINLTLSENSADTDGGVYNQVPQGLTLRNTIVANNVGGDCGGPAAVVSAGHNLSSDDSCELAGPGDLTNTDPLLSPLADNGGPTPTAEPLPGRPAPHPRDNADKPATT